MRKCRSIALLAGLSIAATIVHAQSDYDVTINTSSLVGTGATLTFDFLAGGGTQSNSVTISDFATNGTLVPGGMNSGAVTGALPGTATLTNASFFNELQQGITLGTTISFQVDLTTNAPTGGALPDTLSLFLLDPTATTSLTSTGDPTGGDSLLTVQIDGTTAGDVATYSGTGPSIPITVSAVSGSGPTSAPEMDAGTALAALTLLVGMILVRSARRSPKAACAS
jgi:hypothetical protein